jgi:hypothetical protein
LAGLRSTWVVVDHDAHGESSSRCGGRIPQFTE